jgi:Na+-transporting methylmalonyl-CoA/oxaloacetate decarboxylase gamma subunit
MEYNMEHITDGFKLMAIGMGMVFCFLALMVIIMHFLAKILNLLPIYLKKHQQHQHPLRKEQHPNRLVIMML